MKHKKLVGLLSSLGKILIGLIIISPIILGFLMSFMTAAEFSNYPPSIIPESFALDNYKAALRSLPLVTFMINSFIVCAIVIMAQMVTCSFSAYAFTFFDFKGKKILFMCVLATMMIPAEATIIANFLTISSLKLNDTYPALVLPYLTSAMGIFLMRQYFLTVPKEIKEAAIIDGCNDLNFMFRVLIPISTPVLASLGIYVFIHTYNQYFWPLLVTNSDKMRTIQIGMSMLKMAEAVDYGAVLAGAVMVLLPSVFVFSLGQRYIVKGMVAGSVKG
ncbi:carbohydrate ABC transporter permease [Oscillospiraceae bacterium PP1C4]